MPSATVLGGCVPPARQTAAAKRAWRAGVLRAQHVPTAQLRTLDQVDAALAALTGIIALELRDPFAPGMPDEGRIVLPARVVPAAGYRRCVQTRAFATEPLITFCACGCGAQTQDRQRVPSGPRPQADGAARARGGRGRASQRRAEAAGMGVTGDHDETRAIHAGQDPDAPYGAVSVPIYQTSTYAQDDVAAPKVWDYGRGGNPTREAFQQALASLEGGAQCFAFASGMAAEIDPAAHAAARRSRGARRRRLRRHVSTAHEGLRPVGPREHDVRPDRSRRDGGAPCAPRPASSGSRRPRTRC